MRLKSRLDEFRRGQSVFNTDTDVCRSGSSINRISASGSRTVPPSCSLDLFRATGDENYIKYAQVHYDLIARFGRFPHRNEAMGRVSTQEERDYLASGGFSG